MPWDASAGGGFTTGTPWYGFAPGRDTANVAAQTGDPGSLLSRYRKLIRARHASAALTRGTLDVLLSSGPILAFVRSQGDERVLVAHNLGGAPETASLSVAAAGGEPLFVDDGVALTFSGVSAGLTMSPHASAILRLK
jgi:glycosidase